MSSKKGIQDKTAPRADLAEVLAAKAQTLDENRPEAIAKRAATGHQMIRQNISQLIDPGSFQEYGQLAEPAFQNLQGPADGLVIGTGTVSGFRVGFMGYDYTVHAGTQSIINHAKADRFLQVVESLRLPLILWADGGGWRPYENNINSRDYEETFAMMARLSGLVPTVGVVSGRCFAGNANLAGLCDTLIATPKAALGMGGPPLVEAALGLTLTPEELGPCLLYTSPSPRDA